MNTDIAIVGDTEVYRVDVVTSSGKPTKYSGRYVVPTRWVIYTSDTYYNRVYHDGYSFVVRLDKQWRRVWMTGLKNRA